MSAKRIFRIVQGRGSQDRDAIRQMGGTLLKLRLTLTLAIAAIVISALPSAAGALNRPPNGNYVCSLEQEHPYAPGVLTGRSIRVIDRNTYSFFNARRWRRGTYRYIAARDVVRFETGPLQGKRAKHETRFRRHRLTLVIRRPSSGQGPVVHECTRD